MASPEGADALVHAAVVHYGRVDAVISNAGILVSTRFDDIAIDDWRRMMSVHLDGGFLVSQRAYRVMRAQGYGRIVFASSSAGMFGRPLDAHYAAAKAGLVGLANVIALEGAQHGIMANTVLPFGVSRMADADGASATPEQRAFLDLIRPEFVVPMAVFLASRDCRVSHHNYSAGGGRYARVFVGLADGWVADGEPTVEAIAEHFDLVSATEPHEIPSSIYDEAEQIVRRARPGGPDGAAGWPKSTTGA